MPLFRELELLEDIPLQEGTKVLVTILPEEDESMFWLQASQSSLEDVWDNPQNDTYAKLLEI